MNGLDISSHILTSQKSQNRSGFTWFGDAAGLHGCNDLVLILSSHLRDPGGVPVAVDVRDMQRVTRRLSQQHQDFGTGVVLVVSVNVYIIIITLYIIYV